MSEKTFYTETMAKVQEGQGHLDKAEGIYRHLLESDPENEDFRAAVNRIHNKRTNASIDTLSPLVREWIGLLLEYKKLKSLRTIMD